MNGATFEGDFLTVADPRMIGLDLTPSEAALLDCLPVVGPDVEKRFDRLPSLRWSEFDRFLKSGVPARALVYPDLPARARVVFFPGRPLFDFAEDVGEEVAVPAFVFLARDEFGDACDLVAWAPGEARVAAWLGRASMLGLESLWAPRIAYDGALPVCETPLEWLRAERRAVVILDSMRARWSLFRTNLIVSDVAFGCRVPRGASLARPANLRRGANEKRRMIDRCFPNSRFTHMFG